MSSPLPASATDILREQAATIAHYKKMYDRSSALARIGVWECDLATNALTWTDGVYDLFELPRGHPISRAEAVKLYAAESREEMERLRAHAIATGGSFSTDARVRTAKGTEKWIRLTADVEQENGRSIRIFGTKQDITQEKAIQEKVHSLQAELIHASRTSAMGAMAATLAHELNQPLTAISNYAAGTRRALGGDGQERMVAQGLKEIEKSAARAGAIIRSLRELTNGSTVRRQFLNPNPLLREAAALALTGSSVDIALHYDFADVPMAWIDPIQIQQVFINIIRNAVEALRDCPRREIGISTSVLGGSVLIRIEDSGAGVPREILETVFESFVSSKPDGMGVGLSISRTIVEAHGGDIMVENKPGGGASFCLTLPLIDESEIPG